MFLRRILPIAIIVLLVAMLMVLFTGAPLVVTGQSPTPTPVAAQRISKTPITPTFTTVVSSTFGFYNNGKAFAYIKSTYTGTVAVTIVTPYEFEGYALDDLEFNLPAAGGQVVGPFPPVLFNDSNDAVYITFSPGTSLTVAALRY
jgi:hypothetical protein